jgi:Putative zinc-finger
MNRVDHADATAGEMAGRYVAGSLGQTDRVAFEAHLVECAECLDGVEEASGLRRGLLAAAEADTVQMAAVPRPGRAPLSPRFALALAAAVACWLVPLVFLAIAGSRKDGELAATRRELQVARTALEAGRRPLADVPVLRVRPAQAAAPVPHLAVEAAAPWVVLIVELEPPPADGRYELALADDEGRPVWTGSGLRPRDGTLVVGLPSVLMPPGHYHLAASRDDGARVAASAFELNRP